MVTEHRKIVFNENVFLNNINSKLQNKLGIIAEKAIEHAKTYYLSRRKEKVFDLIVHSMVYSTASAPYIGVAVDVTIDGSIAPYAIFVDRGFTAPGGGAKIFEGYHFSDEARNKINEGIDDVAVKSVVESLRRSLVII